MNIVGFNFTEITAVRKKSAVGKINISNNISIKDVRETKIGLGENRSAVSIVWVFQSRYKPDVANIDLSGEVLLLLEPKRAGEIKAKWDEKKSLPKDLAQNVMNHVLERCNIQALLLSKDLNLPSPVPLPKVQVAGVQGETKGDSKEVKKTSVKKKKK